MTSLPTKLIAAICFLLTVSSGLRAAPDALDPSFGVGGRTATNFSTRISLSAAHGAVLQPDGKIVAAGSNGISQPFGFSVVRLLPDGSPDASFNSSGQTSVFFDQYSGANAVALQADGRIVAAGGRGFGPDNVVAMARFLPDGSLDTSFNATGSLTTAVGNFDAVAIAVAIQPDGKIVVATSSTAIPALIRYQADGTLDTTFGGSGTGIVMLTSGLHPSGLALQPDGKIVAVGDSTSSVFQLALARFTANGAPDTSFNATGMVLTGFEGINGQGGAVAIQPDGRIVAAGTSRVGSINQIAVARYHADGSPDPAFGVGGKVTTAVGSKRDAARAVAVLPDGRIVVAGVSSTGVSQFDLAGDFALVRYHANGALDTTFGGTGIVTTKVRAGNHDEAEALVVQGDGKVIAAGTSAAAGFGGGSNAAALVRYGAGGSVDATFGQSGTVLTLGGFSEDLPFALSLRPDGTLLAAGSSDGGFAVAAYSAGGALAWKRALPTGGSSQRGAAAIFEQPDGRIVLVGTAGSETSRTFTLLRLDADGLLDPTFNGTGRVDTFVGGGSAGANAAVRQPDGKIVVAGGRQNGEAPVGFALARYDNDGSLDGAFGSGGVVTTAIGSGEAYAYAIALQGDGKIVAAGASLDGAVARFAVVRYNADGSLDASFGTDGKVTRTVGEFQSVAKAIALQPDGRIVLAGLAFNNGAPAFAVVRYNVDGSPDIGFGTGGTVMTAMGGSPYSAGIGAITIRPDGRIVAVGDGLLDGEATFALARYLENGALDPTFGTGGRIHVPTHTSSAYATALALQGTTTIVLAGWVNDGNADFDLVRVFGDDAIAPDTAIVAGPGSTSGPVVSFSFTATDLGGSGVSSFECALDGGAFTTCTSPKGYSGLAEGAHTFQVRARDGAGHVDASPATSTWTVVPAAQVITFAPLPDRVLGNPPFVVAATGGASGNPVVFSSLTPGVCTTSATDGSLVTLAASGTCTIAASQAAGPGYLAAEPVARSFQVFATGFTLAVSLAGSGSGRVVSAPEAIDCGSTCQWTFPSSTNVTLLPSSAAGSTFTGWGGACSGVGPCQVTMDAARSVTASFALTSSLGRMVGISTRARVLTGDDVMIGGFIIQGTTPKTVVVRARGPSLEVAGALADPTLTLVPSSGPALTNDDWGHAVNASALLASGFAPGDPKESAILATLAPGAYTAIVGGRSGTTGIAIVEVYELGDPDSSFLGISTRGLVQAGDDVMIAGFIIEGPPQTFVIRARGPSLGLAGALANPALTLVPASGPVVTNDNWGSAANAAALMASGFAPADSQESAILVTLGPGAYTAIVNLQRGATGVGIVEVYRLP